MDGHARVCIATKRNGEPCSVQALPGSAYCFAHDPASADQRSEWRKQGGKARGHAHRLRRRVPDGLRDVETALYRALAGLESGSVEPTTANAMSNIARALAALHEPAEIEKRLTAIETELNRLGKAAS